MNKHVKAAVGDPKIYRLRVNQAHGAALSILTIAGMFGAVASLVIICAGICNMLGL